MKFARTSIVLVVVLGFACRAPLPSNELMGGLRSGASPQDAEGVLARDGYKSLSTIQDAGVTAEDPKRMLMQVNDYQHLGQKGSLALGFYDDLLVRVEFRPADLAAYLAAYRADTGSDLEEGPHRRGAIEIFLWNKIDDPPPFVGWEDTTLRARFRPSD